MEVELAHRASIVPVPCHVADIHSFQTNESYRNMYWTERSLSVTLARPIATAPLAQPLARPPEVPSRARLPRSHPAAGSDPRGRCAGRRPMRSCVDGVAGRSRGDGDGAVAAVAVVVARVVDGVRADGLVRLDSVTAVMLALVAIVGWVVVRFSATYLAGDVHERRYAGRMLATLAAVSVVVVSNHLRAARGRVDRDQRGVARLAHLLRRPARRRRRRPQEVPARPVRRCLHGRCHDRLRAELRHAPDRRDRGRRCRRRLALGRGARGDRAGRDVGAAEVRAAPLPRLADPGDGGTDAGVGVAARRCGEPRRVRAVALRPGRRPVGRGAGVAGGGRRRHRGRWPRW